MSEVEDDAMNPTAMCAFEADGEKCGRDRSDDRHACICSPHTSDHMNCHSCTPSKTADRLLAAEPAPEPPRTRENIMRDFDSPNLTAQRCGELYRELHSARAASKTASADHSPGKDTAERHAFYDWWHSLDELPDNDRLGDMWDGWEARAKLHKYVNSS